MCIRLGPRFNNHCISCIELMYIHVVIDLNDRQLSLSWGGGVSIVGGRIFQCSFDEAKSNLFRAFNTVYSEIEGTPTEKTTLTSEGEILTNIGICYIDACPMLSREKQSIQFTIVRRFVKLVKTGLPTIITISVILGLYSLVRNS